ncbi:LysR family transcriptional regulator [Palleronia sp. KMU-117]|uniref:LysR family transcriptional regulator n=1 Tax=Palleronia sp. KMU-117 TaxID=3434108 RepID=UPI003D724E77
MNWDDLRIFLFVARAESLSGAARRLKLDPATVGRRIERLEAALGAALFLKSPQGYAMTPAGQRFLDHAEAAEQAAMGAVDAIGGPEAGLDGQIRIGAPDGCANFLLPQVTAGIARANPGLDIQIIALPRIIDLSKREADMAIAVSRPTTGRLTAQKIADYRLCMAASAGYLDRAPAIADPSDLRAHPVVGYIPDMVFDKELDYLAEIGIPAPRFGSNSVAVQLNWLRQGAGVGVVHAFALPAAPGLRKVLPDRVSLARTFWLLRHADDRRVTRLQRFADLLIAGLRQEIAALEGAA